MSSSQSSRTASQHCWMAPGAGWEVETSAPPFRASKNSAWEMESYSKKHSPSRITGMGITRMPSSAASSGRRPQLVSVTMAVLLDINFSFIAEKNGPPRGTGRSVGTINGAFAEDQALGFQSL